MKLPLRQNRHIWKYCSRTGTEEVKYYMRAMDTGEDETLIEAGEKCSNIYIILSGRATGLSGLVHKSSPIPLKITGRGLLGRLNILPVFLIIESVW